jgi:flagellar hook-length control protein FliK
MTLPQLQIVQRVNRAMQCSACGATGIAACDCGEPYLPATARAAKAIAANPEMSDRAIAAEIGVSDMTVGRARKTTATGVAVGRVGRDGKRRQLPKHTEDVMPTEKEADESWQETLYDQACLLLERMAGETRRRFFAYLRRKYNVG